MQSKRYLNAKEAADMLDISIATLYAYVSRGLIRSEQSSEAKRQRRYYAEDVEKLLARKEGRRNPEKLAQDALHWGAPVLDSAITLLDSNKIYYRGFDAVKLAREKSVEEVAALIWTGDMANAEQLFNWEQPITAKTYETMILHLEMDGASLSPIQELQTFLPAAAADDPSAYDLRPATVANVGARIMRLMASVAAGDVPEDIPLPAMLQHGWCEGDKAALEVLNAALIMTADHELNASSFAARVVASAGSTPYAAVMAGLAALQGVKHGGYTERIAALFNEAGGLKDLRRVMASRLQRGESIPGFGHMLYPKGDPRGRLLLDMLGERYPKSPELAFVNEAIAAARDLIGEEPTIDVALVALARILHLPAGGALTLFALGRTIGWIGHAIEEYESNRMIRPRARYTGAHPE
jgi:citrate synthase